MGHQEALSIPCEVPGCGMQLETKKPQTVQLNSARPSAGVSDRASVKVELAGVVQSTSNSHRSMLSVGGFEKYDSPPSRNV